jgi:hypothetical protein
VHFVWLLVLQSVQRLLLLRLLPKVLLLQLVLQGQAELLVRLLLVRR